jgi:hypothetical protein
MRLAKTQGGVCGCPDVQSAECQASAGFCGARTEMKLVNDEIDGYMYSWVHLWASVWAN